jgi:hypothetical protein
MLGVKREEVIAMGAILLAVFELAAGVLLTRSRVLPEGTTVYGPP